MRVQQGSRVLYHATLLLQPIQTVCPFSVNVIFAGQPLQEQRGYLNGRCRTTCSMLGQAGKLSPHDLIAGQGDTISGSVSRADVAAVCVAALQSEAAQRVTLELISKPERPVNPPESIFENLKPDA